MFRRLFAALLILAAIFCCLAALWPQLFGLQRAEIVAQVVSLRGLSAVVAVILIVVLLILAVVARPTRGVVTSLVLVLVCFGLGTAAVLGTRGIDSATPLAAATPLPDAESDEITVLSWNTLGDATGVDAITGLALSTDADIIALPETTLETATAVAAAISASGKAMTVTTIAFDTVSKARSTSVIVADSLGEYVRDESAGNTLVLPTVVLRPADGSGPSIVAVHAVAPIRGYMQAWRSDLAWIAGLCADDNVIMAGDFNATVDNMAGLGTDLSDGIGVMGACRDAALEAGRAGLGTWPTSMPAIVGAPIDHVLSSTHWETASFRVIETLDTSGSDHRPVVASIRPAGG
jgi:endonuclease/exonuclease/phosphatase (EEP) superfamily protein YafD